MNQGQYSDEEDCFLRGVRMTDVQMAVFINKKIGMHENKWKVYWIKAEITTKINKFELLIVNI